MALAVEWSGQATFNSRQLREWEYNGATVGKTRSAGNLTFATVYGAGHMVCPVSYVNCLIDENTCFIGSVRQARDISSIGYKVAGKGRFVKLRFSLV